MKLYTEKQLQYILPTTQSYDPKLLSSMLAHIGCLDSKLRDELIYTKLTYFIMKDEFSSDEMIQLLDYLLNNCLLFNIGKVDQISVYTRSFSLLQISNLINKHNKVPYLNKDKLDITFNKIIVYAYKEHDFRGYTKFGWAHSLAHLADVLLCLSASNISLLQKHQILILIMYKLPFINCQFKNLEDERIANVLCTLQTNDNLHNLVLQEISNFPNVLNINQFKGEEGYYHNVISNTRMILKSLHIICDNDDVRICITNTLKALY